MKGNESGQADYRNFALPICLLSLVFFILFALIIAVLLSGIIQTILSFFIPNLPGDIVFQLFPAAICYIFFILSFVGLLLVIRQMKVQSLKIQDALPFCGGFVVIIASATLEALLPTSDFHKLFFVFWLFALTSLPIGAAILLEGLKKIDLITSDFTAIQSFSYRVGYLGLFIAVLITYFSLTYVPGRRLEMYDINPLGIAGIVLIIIYVFILLPALGIKLLKLGLQFQKEQHER
jgi:hypothetical protein